jgi:hypothetical protein
MSCKTRSALMRHQDQMHPVTWLGLGLGLGVRVRVRVSSDRDIRIKY